jgi:D-alanine-D-alanine ligase
LNIKYNNIIFIERKVSVKKVAVLMGGISEERKISLKTGNAVLKALNKKGYITKKIDTKDDFIDDLKTFNPDTAFIALHGPYGEDGTIQGLLEILKIPYCGCDVLSSAVAMNKIYTKKILYYDKIPTADFKVLNYLEYVQNKDEIINNLYNDFNLPLVTKAPRQGSSIGVYFIRKKNELQDSIEKTFKYDKEILIEKFIEGKEYTVVVIGDDLPKALPIIEIISLTGVYDYKAKYTKGLSKHIVPADLPKQLEDNIKMLAVKAYNAIGCKNFARVDFIVDNSGNPYVLEINTIPGMTETSLLPDAARASGIAFEDILDHFIKLSLGENSEL